MKSADTKSLIAELLGVALIAAGTYLLAGIGPALIVTGTLVIIGAQLYGIEETADGEETAEGIQITYGEDEFPSTRGMPR